jgi:prepilin-type N-terminal cleavage/methylation domain-containing protein
MERKNSFTLIELLVVIAVIGMLSSIVLVSMRGAREKARDARRKQEIDQIMKALELYYNDYGQYPPSGGATYPNSGWSNSNDSSWDTLKGYLANYISLPKDPLNQTGGWPGDGKYSYAYFSLGYGCPQQWYMLVYKLERPDIASPGVKACDGTYFNYGGTITIGMCPGCK